MYANADLDLSFLLGDHVDREAVWNKLFELQSCSTPNNLGDTIIMVNESLVAGARYLSNPTVSSKHECEFECCYQMDKGCDVAVYAGEEVGHDCSKHSDLKLILFICLYGILLFRNTATCLIVGLPASVSLISMLATR